MGGRDSEQAYFSASYSPTGDTVTHPRLSPDLILWSSTRQSVYSVELSAPWGDETYDRKGDDVIHEAYERRKLGPTEVEAKDTQLGCSVRLRPVEVGCCKFVAVSTGFHAVRDSRSNLQPGPAPSHKKFM